MSASSGIAPTPDLAARFSAAVESKAVRFLKISIQNETLVHELSLPVEGTLDEDLARLQDAAVLQDKIPAYLLVRLDAPSEWLAVFYVPTDAAVRDKFLYSSTRAALLRALGSGLFTDSLFATSRDDLTPAAYAAHRRHAAAPQPLSAREQAMADVRAAERAAGGDAYAGAGARQSHVGTGVGLHWAPDVEVAVRALGEGEGAQLVVINIDTPSETLTLSSTSDTGVDQLGAALPPTDPCYAFFAWPHTHTSPPRREIVFIYSCPSNSPIKHRMVYSSGASSVFLGAKSLLSALPSGTVFATRKIETSDPRELDEAYLKSELGLEASADTPAGTPGAGDAQKAFAKPRGPARRR